MCSLFTFLHNSSCKTFKTSTVCNNTFNDYFNSLFSRDNNSNFSKSLSLSRILREGYFNPCFFLLQFDIIIVFIAVILLIDEQLHELAFYQSFLYKYHPFQMFVLFEESSLTLTSICIYSVPFLILPS